MHFPGEDLERIWSIQWLGEAEDMHFYNCKNSKSISTVRQVWKRRLILWRRDQTSAIVWKSEVTQQKAIQWWRTSVRIPTTGIFHNKICGLQLAFPAYVYNLWKNVRLGSASSTRWGSGYPYRMCHKKRAWNLLAAWKAVCLHQVVNDYRTAIGVPVTGCSSIEAGGRPSYCGNSTNEYLRTKCRGDRLRCPLIRRIRWKKFPYLCRSCVRKRHLPMPFRWHPEEKMSQVYGILTEYPAGRRKHPPCLFGLW